MQSTEPQARRGCWTTLYHYWEALHVERHGKYSVERLYSLKLHNERTSLVRCLLAILLMPIPCILTTILADLIPLAPPELGLAHSQMFWIRATCVCWYISFMIVNQCRYFIVQLPITSVQVLSVNTFVVATSILIGYAFAKAIGFPLPFFQAMITPGWMVGLVVSIVFVWGKHFKDDPRMKREMVHYAYVVTAQTCLTVVYPAYIFAFRKLSGSAQVSFAFFLPVMKVFAKNGMDRLLLELEDAEPEFIIFNVEVFHALFVACCMQTLTSYYTTIILMTMDCFFAGLSIRKIVAVIHALDDLVKGDDEEDGDDWEKIEFLRSLSHVEAAIFLLQSDPTLWSNSAIRMRSYRRGSIAPAEVAVVQSPVEAFKMKTTELRGPANDLPSRTTAVLPLNKPIKSKSSRVFTSRAFGGRRVGNSSKGDKIQTPEMTSKPSESSSVWRPSPFKTRRTMTKLGAEITTKLSDGNKQALLVLSDASKAKYVQYVLRVLHWTEFLLLAEFAEMIIPIVYSAYLSVAYRLPNKVCYAQLRNTDDAKFHASIAKILIYALLEGISLVFLGVVLHRQLKLSAV